MFVKFKNMNVFNKAKYLDVPMNPLKKDDYNVILKQTSLVFYFRNQMIIYNYMKVKYHLY